MPPTDRPTACNCMGSGYSTPTGHHPGCPEHVRRMRRERYRTTDGEGSVGGPVTTDVPLRAHLAWVAEKARAMEELTSKLAPSRDFLRRVDAPHRITDSHGE